MKKNAVKKATKGDKILSHINDLNQQIDDMFKEVQKNRLDDSVIETLENAGEKSISILKNQYKLSSKIASLQEKQEKIELALVDVLNITSEISAVQNSLNYKIENIGLTLEEQFREKVTVWQRIKNFFSKKTAHEKISAPTADDAVTVATQRLKESCRVYNKKQEYAQI